MQQSSSSSISSPASPNIPYSPLIPVTSSPPTISTAGREEADQSLLPYNDNNDLQETIAQARGLQTSNGDYLHHRTQSSDQYFYPDGGFHSANSPPLTAPPPIPLPPSPPSIGIKEHARASPPLQVRNQYNHPQYVPNNLSQTPPGLYDSPHSPRLPSSPGLDGHPNHAFQQQQQQQQPQHFNSLRSNASYASSHHTGRSASSNGYPAIHNSALIAAAGVPLPSSPYSSFHSLNSVPPRQPYPARTASVSPSERSLQQQQLHGQVQRYPSSDSLNASRQGSQQYTPPPRGASNNYNNLPNQYQQPYNNSPTNAAFPFGAAAGQSPLPSPTYLHPNSQQHGAAASYYSHPNATESTIWNGGDNSGTDYDTSDIEDEKKAGGYGPLDRGIGLNTLSHSHSSNSLSSEKRGLRNGSAAAVAGGKGGRRKKWWIIAGIALLGEYFRFCFARHVTCR